MKKENVEVIVYVEGGVVQGAVAKFPKTVEVAFEVFDVDNLRAEDEDNTRDDIEKEWKKLTKGMKAVY